MVVITDERGMRMVRAGKPSEKSLAGSNPVPGSSKNE